MKVNYGIYASFTKCAKKTTSRLNDPKTKIVKKKKKLVTFKSILWLQKTWNTVSNGQFCLMFSSPF